MLIEISLAIIAIALIGLVITLIIISSQSKQVIFFLQTDAHSLSKELTKLLSSLNEFVDSDLHVISQKTTQLLSKLTDLSADVNNKSHSLNVLFKPLNFLRSKLSLDSSSDESSTCEAIPQTMKWITSSVVLFKTIKEFVKNGKRT